jgi:hypothetical protein
VSSLDRRWHTGTALVAEQNSGKWATLICHCDFCGPAPIALLAATVGLSTCFALLVTAISFLPLLTPDCGTAFEAAVALPTITGNANSEDGPAIRVAA